MPISRPLAVAVALAAAAALLLTLSYTASAAPAKAPPAKVKLVRQISKLDGQFHSLRARVRKCAPARTDLRVAQRQRNAAAGGATVRRTTANLKARRALMAASVVRLSRAAKACGASTTPAVATVDAVPGPTAGTAMVLLPDLLGGVSLEVAPLLGGLPLGDVLQVVDVDQLVGPLCQSPGVSCVGIDGGDLLQAVRRLLAADLLASLLDLDVAGTLATVRALLGAGDLTRLVRVERVSDTVLRLVPVGALADLAALPAVPALPVGIIDVLG
jgi:hypothetical protein